MRSVAALLLGILATLAVGPGCQQVGDPADATEGRGPPAPPTLVTALGRIEPRDGIIRVAGPARPTVVIAKLFVDEGDRVKLDQPLAELDSLAEDQARVAKAKAALKNAETELARIVPLLAQRLIAAQARDDAQMRVDVARADLAAAQAALDLAVVRAPVAGQVVAVHARRGERVGPGGLAEIAQNDQMFAMAEVYETDIGRVKLGQRATIRSPALAHDLAGTVDRVGMKIGKLDVLDTDPVARTDARVVEVRVKLDDSPRAAGFSNLQVEVVIQP